MSEYSFGYDDSDDTSGAGEQQSAQQGPKWFRDYMDKVSGQLTELKAENDRLKATQVKTELEKTLKAKGYAPNAAELYTGTPDKLDDWLGTYGAALAKLPAEGGEQLGEQAPPGPPASTVPADGQEQMQRMAEAGASGVAPPQGTDKEIAAALAAATSREDFDKIMKSHGSPFDWTSS